MVYIHTPHQVNIQGRSRLQCVQSVCQSIYRAHRLTRVADYVECLQSVQRLCECLASVCVGVVCRCGCGGCVGCGVVDVGAGSVQGETETEVYKDKLQEVLTEYLQSISSEALGCLQRALDIFRVLDFRLINFRSLSELTLMYNLIQKIVS